MVDFSKDDLQNDSIPKLMRPLSSAEKFEMQFKQRAKNAQLANHPQGLQSPQFTPKETQLDYLLSRVEDLEKAVFGQKGSSILEGKTELFLKEYTPNVEWVKEHPVGKYRIDFALPSVKLAIEVDGHEWHSSKERRTHDAKRDRWLVRQGWTVMRFTGSELVAENFMPLQEIADYLRSMGITP